MFLMFLVSYGENLCIFVVCFLREGRTQTGLEAGNADKGNGEAYDLDRLARS